MQHPDDAYEGEVKDGKPHGRGKLILTTEHGDGTYEGDFKDGLQHGRGKFLLADGSCLISLFRASQPIGEGVADSGKHLNAAPTFMMPARR